MATCVQMLRCGAAVVEPGLKLLTILVPEAAAPHRIAPGVFGRRRDEGGLEVADEREANHDDPFSGCSGERLGGQTICSHSVDEGIVALALVEMGDGLGDDQLDP